MPNILVRGLSERIIEARKSRAARHRRSLQREVLHIIEGAVAEDQVRCPGQLAGDIRAKLAKSGPQLRRQRGADP